MTVRQWYRYVAAQVAGDLGERATMWVAWHLPRSLVKWCYIRVAAEATSRAPLNNVHVPEIRTMDALGAWK